MAKVPALAKAFAGRWRIVEMDNWDNDFLDLVEEAHLDFKGATDRWDCQEFRVQAGIMGRKESHYVPTQRAFDTE